MSNLDPEDLQIGWFVLVKDDATEYVVVDVTPYGINTILYGLRKRHGGSRVCKRVDWKKIVAVSKTPFITSAT